MRKERVIYQRIQEVKRNKKLKFFCQASADRHVRITSMYIHIHINYTPFLMPQP